MIKLPPGIMMSVDPSNEITGLRNLKIEARPIVRDLAEVTITFEITQCLINDSEVTVNDMNGKAHFSFTTGTRLVDEKNNLRIFLEPINPTVRGLVDVYSGFTFSDGKVGGAGPKAKFKELVSRKSTKKKR